MKIDEVRLVIQETINELRKTGMLRQPDSAETKKLLQGYYDGTLSEDTQKKLEVVLESLRHDRYYKIIPLYYEKGLIIEDIAYTLAVDTSTIVRNKKRLLEAIYNGMN